MKACRQRLGEETGVALLTTLMIIVLITALMAGFFAAVNADVRSNALDRDQTKAYAAAHAGLEKLTSDLASLFTADVSPSVSQINALAANAPVIPGFSFVAPGGAAGSGYTVTWKADSTPGPNYGNPLPEDPNGSNITAGPYKGFKGIITKYPITITARSTSGGAEVRLRRELQTVAVPVFQFGVFSDTDLTFFAGDDFDFGGRVHTNGNLFLSELTGKTLKFTDYITAVGEVIHAYFSNGLSVSSNSFAGTVEIPTAIGTSPGRNLKLSPNEGSVTGMPGSAANTSWDDISRTQYKSIIRNTATGAKVLNLPLVSQGATPIDLIRRAPAGEDTSNPPVYGQRFYSQAALRILLSDRDTDLTTLPAISSGAPTRLDNWLTLGVPAGYGPVDASHPPIARTPAANAAATATGAISSGNLNVSSVPAELKIPVITLSGTGVKTNATTTGPTPLTCTGIVDTSSTHQLLGCTAGFTQTLTASSRDLTATVSYGTVTWTASAKVTTALVLSTSAAAAITVTFSTPIVNTFQPRRTFWLNQNSVGSTTPGLNALVTCTGYDATPRFTGCAALGTGAASIANGWTLTTNSAYAQDTANIGGYIKIERQNVTSGQPNGTWTDVTAEILNLGISGPSQEGCIANPTTTAIIQLQRLRDNGQSTVCDAVYTNPYDYWPNMLFDTREGNWRDVANSGGGSGMSMGGVMSYVALDVSNLKKWFAGTIGSTGTQAINQNGYIVYFSDRRGNHNPGAATANAETAEYGFEDVVNNTGTNKDTGIPNGVLEPGEDLNTIAPATPVLDVYGQLPNSCAAACFTLGNAPYDSTNARPWTYFQGTTYNPAQARINRPVLFRRALKLVNGGIVASVNSLPTAGLTVAAENPVYVQGNYNSTTDPTAAGSVPASVLADAVTLLSNNWIDINSFKYPNDATLRDASTTGYRMAVVAGKGVAFTWPTGLSPAMHFLYGTDGGVGNFLRLLEDWNPTGRSINYRGSIVSLYTSRQATGTFKWYGGGGNPNVYNFGDRNFSFDTNFLVPSLLPPGTPMFRDVNTLTFRQILRPTQ